MDYGVLLHSEDTSMLVLYTKLYGETTAFLLLAGDAAECRLNLAGYGAFSMILYSRFSSPATVPIVSTNLAAILKNVQLDPYSSHDLRF